jgi:hypothetical protein
MTADPSYFRYADFREMNDVQLESGAFAIASELHFAGDAIE